MTAMYKIFFAMLAVGAIGGVLFAGWARLFATFESGFVLFVILTGAVGFVWGFANYIFVKWVLRIFVGKFQTLERVLVGTEPQPLPNVFLSNEIDELEASMVRITDQFNKLLAANRSTTGTGRVSGLRPRRATGS